MRCSLPFSSIGISCFNLYLFLTIASCRSFFVLSNGKFITALICQVFPLVSRLMTLASFGRTNSSEEKVIWQKTNNIKIQNIFIHSIPNTFKCGFHILKAHFVRNTIRYTGNTDISFLDVANQISDSLPSSFDCISPIFSCKYP